MDRCKYLITISHYALKGLHLEINYNEVIPLLKMIERLYLLGFIPCLMDFKPVLAFPKRLAWELLISHQHRVLYFGFNVSALVLSAVVGLK